QEVKILLWPHVEDFSLDVVVGTVLVGHFLVSGTIDGVLLVVVFFVLRLASSILDFPILQGAQDVETGNLPIILCVRLKIIEELDNQFEQRPARLFVGGRQADAKHPAQGELVKGMIPFDERDLLGLAKPGHQEGGGGAEISLVQKGVDDESERFGRTESVELRAPKR